MDNGKTTTERRKAWGDDNGGRILRKIVMEFKDAINSQKPTQSLAVKLQKWLEMHEISISDKEILHVVPDSKQDDTEAWNSELQKMTTPEQVARLVCAFHSGMKQDIVAASHAQRNRLIAMLNRLSELIPTNVKKRRKKTIDETEQLKYRNMIRELHDKAHIDQSALAGILRLSTNSVSRWMTGENAISKPYMMLLDNIYKDKVRS